MTSAANGNPLHRLTPEQIEELGREFQAIHDEVYADLGAEDAHYIRSMIQFQRRLATIGRVELIASRSSPRAGPADRRGRSRARASRGRAGRGRRARPAPPRSSDAHACDSRAGAATVSGSAART